MPARTVTGLFSGPPPWPGSGAASGSAAPGSWGWESGEIQRWLEKCYFPFLVTILIIFAIGVFSFGFSYYGVCFVAIAFAISNFLASKDGRLGTNSYDLVILVISVVSLIPILGWLTQIAGVVVCILALRQDRHPPA